MEAELEATCDPEVLHDLAEARLALDPMVEIEDLWFTTFGNPNWVLTPDGYERGDGAYVIRQDPVYGYFTLHAADDTCVSIREDRFAEELMIVADQWH